MFWLILIWWLVGLGLVVYEMRRDVDVTVEHLGMALVFAVGGPFWLALIAYREFSLKGIGSRVLLKKRGS